MKTCWLLVAVLSVVSPAWGEEAMDYEKHVKPILQARCFACHGALKQEGGLRLDTAAFAIKGGENGAALKPGDAAASLLLKRVSQTDDDERMPPEGEPLTSQQIGWLKTWIAQGAKAPAGELPERDPRDHWAFRAPVRPAVPVVKQAAWAKTPIDAFILAKLEEQQLSPQEPAAKRLLLRRVSLDLIGLPPTIAEQDAFVADNSADAYEKVVTRLLGSQHYGERWGRHWMDVWRYSDWWGLGAEVRNSQKHIWHWRDWIIESLNTDKGYDQMLRDMLAADELSPNDLDRLRASGLLARQYFKFNRTSWLDETVEHSAKAFIGLTFNCAKCHDHKYDPISHQDYYRLRAIFEPYQVRTDLVPGERDFEKGGIPRAFDCNLDAPTFLHLRGDDRNPDKSRAIEPMIPAFLAVGDVSIQPVMLPVEAHQPGLRSFIPQTHLKAAEQVLIEARKSVESARQALVQAEESAVEVAKAALSLAEKQLAAAESEPASIKARAAADVAKFAEPRPENAGDLNREAARAEKSFLAANAETELARAEWEVVKAVAAKKPEAEKKRAAAKTAFEAARKALEAPGETYSSLRGSLKTLESNLEAEASRSKPFPTTSTGRRSMLARWVTERRNPLTARVAVNHIWARHFGRPLVPTVFDFGRKGTPPTHPELLDWLAVEFMDSGWSMKHLHRLIVTSNVYRMSSAVPQSPDADNRFYGRMNPVRMEAQIVRDGLLHLAGDLDPTLGGPSIPVSDEGSRRRSLYFVHSNNDQHPFLAMFDDAKVQECYRRAESIVPQQALALENSKLASASALKIASQLTTQTPSGTDEAFIRAAFLTVLSAEPTSDESAACAAALAELRTVLQSQKVADVETRARQQLVQALLNHNDFVTVR